MYELSGKFWICQDRLIDCSTDEHARYARAAMLKLSDEEMHKQLSPVDNFKPLSVEQVNKYNSFDRFMDGDMPSIKALAFLTRTNDIDPRVYVIEHNGWIRTNKASFYAWEWSRDVVKTMTLSRRWHPGALTGKLKVWCEFWEQQTRTNGLVDPWIDFYEVKTDNWYGCKLSQAGSAIEIQRRRQCSPATACAEPM